MSIFQSRYQSFISALNSTCYVNNLEFGSHNLFSVNNIFCSPCTFALMINDQVEMFHLYIHRKHFHLILAETNKFFMNMLVKT